MGVLWWEHIVGVLSWEHIVGILWWLHDDLFIPQLLISVSRWFSFWFLVFILSLCLFWSVCIYYARVCEREHACAHAWRLEFSLGCPLDCRPYF